MLALLLLAFPLVVWAQEGTQPIAYGQRVEGQWFAPGAGVLYRFSAQQGDIITVTLDALDTSPAGPDPFLILLDDEQRRVLAVDNDSGGNRGARLRFVMPDTADYLIKATVTPESSRSGRFVLSLSLTNPTPTPSPYADAPRIAPLADQQRAELNDSARFRLYAFSAKRGTALHFNVAVENNLPVGLYLYAADFAERLAAAELGSPLEITAPADGLHFLAVARAGESGGGAYTLTARGITSPVPDAEIPTAVAIIPGQTQNGVIGPAFANLFRFAGTANRTVRLDLDTPDGPHLVILVADANFSQVAAGEGSIRALTLPRSGTYYIVAARLGGPNDVEQGAYTLNLQGTLPDATPRPTAAVNAGGSTPRIVALGYGGSVTGVIDNKQYVHYFTFTGNQGDVITLRLTQTSAQTFAPLLYLYDYSDPQVKALVASSDNGQIAGYELPNNGAYLVVVTRVGQAQSDESGNFVLTLEHQ